MLREKARLTQREINEAVGFAYYTAISQVESGIMKLPTDRFADYAKVTGTDLFEFTRNVLAENDPALHEVMFNQLYVIPMSASR